MHYAFDWDPVKDQTNIQKHRLSFRQAATVFRDPNQLSFYDEEHSEEKGETRWITIGLDDRGILCVVVHTFEQTEADRQIRVISARRATKRETTQYQEMNP